MGVGLIIAAVTIGATVATTLFAKGPRSTKGADMAPANLDAFRLTTAEEGHPPRFRHRQAAGKPAVLRQPFQRAGV